MNHRQHRRRVVALSRRLSLTRIRVRRATSTARTSGTSPNSKGVA